MVVKFNSEALNKGVGENVVCDVDREDEQATQVHGNAQNEVLKDQLEELFEQFKDIEDT